MKEHSYMNTALAPSKFGIHNNSHTISKQKPIIRIIHIVAPEIIKTDVEHFRELVQKLTGNSNKPLEKIMNKGKNNISSNVGKIIPRYSDGDAQQRLMKREFDQERQENNQNHHHQNAFLMSSFLGDQHHVDGFMHHDMNEYPLFTFRSSSSQMNTYGEMHLC